MLRGLIHPMDVYCFYTTARYSIFKPSGRGAENRSQVLFCWKVPRPRLLPPQSGFRFSAILNIFCRGAENRTRISRSQSEYTTTVLRPVVSFGSWWARSECRESHSGLTNPNRVYYCCTTLRLYPPCAATGNRTRISSLARTRSTTKP